MEPALEHPPGARRYLVVEVDVLDNEALKHGQHGGFVDGVVPVTGDDVDGPLGVEPERLLTEDPRKLLEVCAEHGYPAREPLIDGDFIYSLPNELRARIHRLLGRT